MGVRWWPPALRFAPYPQTDDRPNVIVDGSANAATVLTLSHWPHAPTPVDLRRDLSAEIAFAYLDHPPQHGPAELVSNNHFDQDGVVSVFALTEPERALANRDLLVEVARVGDFAVSSSREAARVSMTMAAFADASRSPLGADALAGAYDEMCGRLYPEVVHRLPEMLDHPDRFRSSWAEEDAQLTADLAQFESGAVAIEEVPDLDLTMVTLPEGPASAGGHRFGSDWSPRVHPLALHRHIDGYTVLVRQGAWVELRYRYESWVQYASRMVRPRVDLGPLALELTALEPGAATWTFSGVSAITPILRVDGSGESGIAPPVLRAAVERALRIGEPAWDPYAGVEPTA